jgi:hypothetical protein
MIGVYQDDYSPVSGNCFAASVASVLELPLAAVPNFEDDRQYNDSDWFGRWNEWLALLNLTFVGWDAQADWKPKGYSILTCRPPGARSLHAIVALNGEPVWNPMPGYGERIGNLGDWCYWNVFIVLDPASLIDRAPLMQASRRNAKPLVVLQTWPEGLDGPMVQTPVAADDPVGDEATDF